MARRKRRHPAGAPGDWFVDDRCIACGSCWSVAPGLFGMTADGRQFVFIRQPATEAEIVCAQLAAEVCPTLAIGTESGLRWPPHHPVEVAPAVWRCGFNAPETAGGNSFLVRRRAGNLLVDAPRAAPRVVRELARLGGVAHVLLTHRDDVGDAERIAGEFGAQVTIHAGDLDAAPFATHVIDGNATVEVAEGVVAIPTPGHTLGHMMFLLDDGTLFSGDSLAWDPDAADLTAEEFVCWYSWPQQLASLRGLASHGFTQVIPTHGAISPSLSADEMQERLLRLVDRFEAGLAIER